MTTRPNPLTTGPSRAPARAMLRAATEALPMRDAFAVLFFVSVGMLLNPAALLDSPGLILGARSPCV